MLSRLNLILEKLNIESTQSDLYWPKNREGVCLHKQNLRWKCQKLTDSARSKRFYCQENWSDEKEITNKLKIYSQEQVYDRPECLE